MFKKSLMIPFLEPRKGFSTSCNKGKSVYHKQQTKNNICR